MGKRIKTKSSKTAAGGKEPGDGRDTEISTGETKMNGK